MPGIAELIRSTGRDQLTQQITARYIVQPSSQH